MESTDVQIYRPEGESVRITCRKCCHPTSHALLTNVVEDYQNQSQHNLYWYKAEHQTLQCRGCGEFTFRIASTNSDEVDDEFSGAPEHVESVVTYPPRLAGRKGIDDHELWSLDEKIRVIYRETSAALSADLPVLSAIGMRAILETVCKKKSAEGRDLHKKIESLVELRVLSPGNASILHQIRSIGNDAAHEVAPHSTEQLALAMDVIDHLIMDVFLLPSRMARMFPST